MKKMVMFLIVLILLAGCSSNVPEKANTTNQESAKNEQQSDEQYIKVSIDSAFELLESANELKTLLVYADVENEGWQSEVEDTLMDISKATNDYMITELDMTDGQNEKFKETKAIYSEGISSFEDIIQDTRKALETYDKKALEYIRDSQLNQANSLILKAKDQLENERY
ncbi:hypothetical protein [Neobacillus drentensis]|uniref:hypothetical protein n=1 Tax=Neobacillus drentensis TaxID=220684 RepID=UPI002FFEF490